MIQGSYKFHGKKVREDWITQVNHSKNKQVEDFNKKNGKSDYFTAKNIFRHGPTYRGLVLASLFVRLFDLGVCLHEIYNTPKIIKPPLLSLCYLATVDLHDQRPSTTSAWAKVISHVTVHRDYCWCQLKGIGFVSFRPDEYFKKMGFLDVCQLSIIRWLHHGDVDTNQLIDFFMEFYWYFWPFARHRGSGCQNKTAKAKT